MAVEQVSQEILKILGLDETDEIDMKSYKGFLREKLVEISMGKGGLSREEELIVQSEFQRVKKQPDTVKVKKKITAESFKRGSAVGINLMKNVSPGIVKPTLSLAPALKGTGNIANEITPIITNLDEIIGLLNQQNKDEKKKQEQERKKKEDDKRKRKEKLLETGAGKVFKLAQKVFAPVKSLLSRIVDFITAVFFGRALIKLIDWFSDDKNKKKVDSILRFLGDNWPKLLSLYLLFGTSLGKFARGLVGLLFRGGAQLAKAAAALLAKAGVKGAGKVAGFLGGRYGKLAVGALEVGTIAAGAFGLSKGIEDFKGIGGEQKPPEAPKPQKFNGGGLAHLKNLFGFAGGSLVSAPGLVSGPKGIDRVPAMLTDGEFVMSRGAVEKYGVDTLEAMNAAGGGTNVPRIMSGVPYAAGGGLIGSAPKMSSLQVNVGSRARRSIPMSPIRVNTSLSNNVGGSFGSRGGDYSTRINAPRNSRYQFNTFNNAYNYMNRGYFQSPGRANISNTNNTFNPAFINQNRTANTFIASRPTELSRGSNFVQRISSFFIPRPVASERTVNDLRPAQVSRPSMGGRYTINPPSKSNVRVVYTTAGGKGSSKVPVPNSGTPKLPSFSASHPTGHSRTAKVLGIR